jgi:hypothetical protein
MVHLLDEKQITENYEKLRKLINQTFTGERLQSLNKMYDHLEDRIVLTPASSTAHFHNAFAGGYIEHVLRVTQNAVKVFEMYEEVGIGIGDYDRETVIFTALHHDLGKVGNADESWYIPNDSQWHIENQGKVYKTNSAMHWMNLNDRTFWMLNHFGITISEIEYLGIKLTDGLYDDGNKPYFIGFGADKTLKSSLPFVMHQADIMASRFENERWLKLQSGNIATKKLGGRPAKKTKLQNIKMPAKVDFKSIFGEGEEA